MGEASAHADPLPTVYSITRLKFVQHGLENPFRARCGWEGTAACYEVTVSVPEPASLLLLATGLGGIVGVGCRRRRLPT